MSTTVTWTATSGGDWSNAANWSDDAVPNSNDNVLIATSSVQTITYGTGSTTINELSVGNDHFVIAGGSLEILTTATFNDGYVQTGGTIEDGSIKILKSGTLTGGSATGSTVFNIAGGIALADYTLAGSAVMNNNGIAHQTGQIVVGDDTGVDATINNLSAGTYQIAGDYGIYTGAASAVFDNAGTLAKTSGSGTSTIGIDIVSTGTLSANLGGTLAFTGPNDTVAGALTGAGQIAFAGDVALAGGTITVGTLGILGGADLTFGSNTVVTGSLEASGNGVGTLALGANTLTMMGSGSALSESYPFYVLGSGELVNTGTLEADDVLFQGGAGFSNSGTVNQAGIIGLGDLNTQASSFVNATSGVWNATGGASDNLTNGTTSGSSFTNEGLFNANAGSGFAVQLNTDFINEASGTIDVTSGSLLDNGSLTSSGTLAGTATLTVAGTLTLDPGTVLAVGTIAIRNAIMNLGVSLSYGGVFVDASNQGTTQLNLGANTLTLTGATNAFTFFDTGGEYVEGTGTLVNAGTLAVVGVTVGGGSTLKNTGTVNQTGFVTVGDAKASFIDNAAGAIWNAGNGSASIGIGASGLSAFENYGTFNGTATNGNPVTLNTNFVNEKGATISDQIGVMTNTGSLVNDGTISGGTLVLSSPGGGTGTVTFNAGTSLKLSEIALSNAPVINLGANLAYGGSLVETDSFGDTINLNGHSLTLTGKASFVSTVYLQHVTSGGTLTTKGATQLADVQLGSGASWISDNTIIASGSLVIGDTSSLASTFTNTAGHMFDMANDSGISVGSSMASAFINNGLFELTANSGMSVISAPFVNNGTIAVSSGGTLEFLAGSLSGGGTINGVISTDKAGDIFITHA
jgi:hypothetical protein